MKSLSSFGILNKVINSSLQYLSSNKIIESLIIKKVKDAMYSKCCHTTTIAKSHKNNFFGSLIFIPHYLGDKY